MSDSDEGIGLQEEFQNAAKHVKSCRQVNEDTMLELYGLYKQAVNGACTTKKPAFWDMVGKSKWNSWMKFKELSKCDAQLHYIALVHKIDPDFDGQVSEDSAEGSGGHGLGVTVSTLYHGEAYSEGSAMSPFEICQCGHIDTLKEAVKDGFHVDSQDETGMTLLHWACDRGHQDIVKWLIKSGADVNKQDLELQTPLHYAAVCEFEEIIRLLLLAGADRSLQDETGCTPQQVTDDKNLQDIFNEIKML